MIETESLRVLILLESERDAEASSKTLSLSGCESLVCKDAGQLCMELSRGAGALLVGTEILDLQTLPFVVEILKDQPTWSHIPIIVLLGSGEILTSVDPSFRDLEPLGNVTLLEGPVRLSTLVSTVRASIAYRRRQYQQRQLLCELEKSRREAVEANRAKSDFLANMSHEIRTPLGAVMGFAELLMEPNASDREKQVYMSTIRRNGQILSALIDDILDLAKVEAGRIEVEDVEFSINGLLADVVSSLEPQAARKGLSLNVARSDEAPEMVSSDPLRLKQILMNIIGNAIKFTSVGSIQIRLALNRQTLGRQDMLEIEVEDSGIGISGAQRERLFQPFTQADTSTTRRFGGTGLGLVLSRKLANALGGDLELKWSVPGGGSCFRLTIGIVAF